MTEASSTKNRVLLIGLDGMEPALLEKWVAVGKLPTLARLMKQGAYSHLNSSLPPNSFPAWTSLMTGVNAAKHRVFYPLLFDADTDIPHMVSSASIHKPTLWQLVSAGGQQVGAMGMPMNYPPQQVNGFVISGMEARHTESDFVYPPELKEPLLTAVPDYTLLHALSSNLHLEFRSLRKMITERVKAAHYLLDYYPQWDLFSVVFIASDRASHYFWDAMDETHPNHKHADPRLADAILQIYQQLDTAVASLLEHVGADTDVMIMSDHGFEPCRTTFNANLWLREQGYMGWQQMAAYAPPSKYNRRNWFKRRAVNGLGHVGLLKSVRQLKRRVQPQRQRGQAKQKWAQYFNTRVDWSQTQAFFRQDVGIRINLRGREPHGIVEPGAAYEALRQEIAERLLTVRDPVSGERILHKVYRREEIFHGEYLPLAPDLVLHYRPGFRGYSTTLDATEVVSIGGIPGGTHSQYGILIGHGPRFEQGVQLDKADIMDVAPTILHLLGWQPPAYMDGRVWQTALTSDAQERPLQPIPLPALADEASAGQMSESESKEMFDILKGLGYVE